MDTLAAILKTLLYVGILTASGAVFAAATLRIPPPLDATARRAMRFGASLLLPVALANALVLIVRLGGQFDETTLTAVFSSNFGAAFFMQVTSVALLLTLGDDDSSRGMRLVAAAVATLSIAFSGHAASIGPFEALFVLIHASAVAWWLGSLLLLKAGVVELKLIELDRILRRFSTLATQIVGGLVITGLLLIYVLVEFENFPALSDYERNLIVKLAVVAVVFGLAAYNKIRLTPRVLGGDTNAVKSLKTMINLELVVIGAVLVATAVLTTLTSPHAE